MGKIKTTVGVFGGILNREGKLLLRRREETDSITGESFFKNWELPGGGIMETEKVPYSCPVNELKREADEEVGISIPVDLMPPMYPVLFKNLKGEYDLAMVTPIQTSLEPTKGETIWVSPKELGVLAEEFISDTQAKKQGLKEAKGIVSGYGKRMHCMALKALCFSSNLEYRKQAGEMLLQIQKSWVK
jgi:8-oxo-dGTP pyrophosphatase MutT (NUDIX family)